MQHEITKKGPLLSPDGKLREAGYATSLILDYDRKAILDDGTVLEIKDFTGFAEKVHNKW